MPQHVRVDVINTLDVPENIILTTCTVTSADDVNKYTTLDAHDKNCTGHVQGLPYIQHTGRVLINCTATSMGLMVPYLSLIHI